MNLEGFEIFSNYKFTFSLNLKITITMLSLLTSLISPTSRFLLSTILPFESAGPRAPGGPALTGVHGEVIVPGPTIPSAKKEEKENYVINIKMYI